MPQTKAAPVTRVAGQLGAHEYQPYRQANDLCGQRCKCDALDLHAEAEHEQQIERDIGQVYAQHHRERSARVLHTEQPADQHEVA